MPGLERRREPRSPLQDRINRGHDLTTRLTDDDMQQGIVVRDNGDIVIGAVTLTPTGMDVAGDINRVQWGAVGDFLKRIDGAIQWMIGDWLVYGETSLKINRDEIAELVNRDIHTLNNYAWVSNGVPKSLRKDSLSYGHHALLASSDWSEAEKRYWLKRAEEQSLSVSELRAAIKETQDSPADADGVRKLVTSTLSTLSELHKISNQVEKGSRDKLIKSLESALVALRKDG